MIAALYVAKDGCYYNVPDCDPWDQERDARLYDGPWSVVAHPPCARWCKLARLAEVRYGYKVGDDGGCFGHALRCVREFGGVLEHPAGSLAWSAFGLAQPRHGAWQLTIFGDWVTEVSQVAYGHKARKRTWLLYKGERPPPALDWSEPAPTHQVSWQYDPKTGTYHLPPLTKAEAKATPLPFRDLLIGMARTATTKPGEGPGRATT